MATCSTLDLLDADDDAGDGALDCERDGRLWDPANHGADDDDDELRRVGGHRRSPSKELFVVRGEPTGTSMSRSAMSKKVTRPATSTRPKSAKARRDGGNQTAAVEDGGAGGFAVTRLRQDKHEAELLALREQLAQTHRELAHTREEREELQVAFRRLDQEITNGYNLTERKEKELKIAELLAKNLKMSQMLEKELKSQEALRAANTDLQVNVQRLERQTTLINQVLASVETKHAALVEAHGLLTSNHLAAQERIVELQAQVLHLEANGIKSTTGCVDYEEKLRVWEAKYAELQRKLEDKIALLRAEKDKNNSLERTCEKVLEERNALETEVASVHDKMIQMNGAMKAMEATVEASSSGTHGISLLERMKERVRILEEEMLGKNRLITDLKDTVNGLLNGSSARQSHINLKRRHPGARVTPAKSESVSNRIVSMTQRLRKTEEARDHKSRCLNLLLTMLPQLLQQLDALQDKFHATLESNSILSHAIEQLQSGNLDAEVHNEPAVAMAREGYLLSGPYQPELLMGFTLSKALSEIAPPPPKKHVRFMPFHVRTRVNISDNSTSQGELLLAADTDDPSGVAFLNRSKINAFLHFVQGSAAKAKCKHLLVQKIADLLSTQRDLMHNYSTESAFYKVSVVKLEAEVHQRAKQLVEAQNQLESLRCESEESSAGASSRRIKLLLKLIETIADAPRKRQNTFLTQADGAYASDLLIVGADARTRAGNEIVLDLSGCGIRDEDLEQVLLKMSLGSYHVQELDLGDNEISDDGAATISAFLETSPGSVRILNLRGNTRITPDGVTRLKNGVMKLPGACRVEVDSARSTLSVVTADHEFDTAGRPSVMLQIFLPEQARHASRHDHDQDQSVQQMIDKLENLGFSGTASNWTRAESIYRPAKSSTATIGVSRRPLSKSSSGRVTSRGFKSHHEQKFRALEAAIQRAESKSASNAHVASSTRGISLTQMQHLLKSHGSRGATGVALTTTAPTARSATLLSSQRLAKLQFAQSHLATIRGLGKK